MVARTPQVSIQLHTRHEGEDGLWRIVLAWPEVDRPLVVADREPGLTGERLELLAAVRGLEALDEPSRVTLLTSSRYVIHGLSHGLEEWRENEWCWERYGELTPIKHRDLWLRIDRALTFHHIECRTLRLDASHELAGPQTARPRQVVVPNNPARAERQPASALARGAHERWRSFLADVAENCSARLRRTGEALMPVSQ